MLDQKAMITFTMITFNRKVANEIAKGPFTPEAKTNFSFDVCQFFFDLFRCRF